MNSSKIFFIAINLLLMVLASVRVLLPIYFKYGNEVVSKLNDGRLDVTPFWMTVLVPWDIILAVSGIRSILKNDREQIFENAFRLSVFGLIVIWFINGLGERFESTVPTTFKHLVKQYEKNTRDRMIVDYIQTRFQCCGYGNTFAWKLETGIPKSCCKQGYCNSTSVYSVGCIGPLNDYVNGLNLWLLFTNFPFLELLISLWCCLLTESLPVPNIVFELGDDRDDPERYVPSTQSGDIFQVASKSTQR